MTHTYRNIPWVVAGRGDGLLRQGVYVDAGDQPHNRLLNTLISATGLGLVEDFGDPELAPGILSELTA